MPEHSISEIWASAELLEQTRAGVELWRPVVGSDGLYDVSNFGRIRSWVPAGWRPGGSSRLDKPSPIVPCPNLAGYLCAGVRQNGKKAYRPIHSLIAEAFIGPRPGHFRAWYAGHVDDDRTRNRLDNIRWCTAKVNVGDRIRNGIIAAPLRPFREIDGVKHWQCTACQAWKTEANFARLTGKNARNSVCGILPECRKCTSARRNELRKRARTT